MIDYETLRLLWWLLLGVLLIGFAVTDGFDLGVAVIYRFVGRSDEERRILLHTIEPVWDGNQVWLVLAAGAVFAAFPLLYAAAFSTLYFALMLLLFALILRPVGLSFRDKLAQARWRNGWDWALFASGVVPSVLCGLVVGNLFLGLPFGLDDLHRPISSAGFFGLLRPFALVSGVVSLAMLVLHGACYAALKTEEPLADRASLVGVGAAVVLLAAMAACGVWLGSIEGFSVAGAIDHAGPSNPLAKTVQRAAGAWLRNYTAVPALWLLPAAVSVGTAAAGLALALRRAGLAFIASAIVQASVIGTAAAGLFPFLMPSSEAPSASLTIWDASSSRQTLFIMLVAALVFVPIILGYTIWVFRVLRGRISAADVSGVHY